MKYIKSYENINIEMKKYFVLKYEPRDTFKYEIYQKISSNVIMNNISAIKLFSYNIKKHIFKRHTQLAEDYSLFSFQMQMVYSSDNLNDCKNMIKIDCQSNKFNI